MAEYIIEHTVVADTPKQALERYTIAWASGGITKTDRYVRLECFQRNCEPKGVVRRVDVPSPINESSAPLVQFVFLITCEADRAAQIDGPLGRLMRTATQTMPEKDGAAVYLDEIQTPKGPIAVHLMTTRGHPCPPETGHIGCQRG